MKVCSCVKILEYCAEIILRDFSYLSFEACFVWVIGRRGTQDFFSHYLMKAEEN